MRGFLTGSTQCDACGRTWPLDEMREVGGGIYCLDDAEAAQDDLDAWNAEAEPEAQEPPC